MPPSRFFFLQDISYRKTFFLCALIASGLMTTSLEAHANQREGREQRVQEQHQQPARARISAAQAAAAVEKRYGGKIMGVQTRQSNGRTVYSVKILQTSGHMRTVQVDGQSGAILN